MYTELGLGGGRAIWRSSGSAGAVIPADGCVDLIFRDEEVFVAGPSTCWIETHADTGSGSLGLRLPPGSAKSILGLDLNEIKDQFALLNDLAGPKVTRPARNLLHRATTKWTDAPELFASFMAQSGKEQPWASTIRDHAWRGTPPGQVAELLDWSPRTFRRRMLEEFGYPYLTLVRINRAERAQELLRAGTSPIEAAGIVGYADQSHLSREFQVLVGASPGQFLSSCA